MRSLRFVVAVSTLVTVLGAGPASAYRGPVRSTEIKLDLTSTRISLGDPLRGTVEMSWRTSDAHGNFVDECPLYDLGPVCLDHAGTLRYRIGEKNSNGTDWFKKGRIKKLGSFAIEFSPPGNATGSKHEYVLRLTFRDGFGGRPFYGSTASENFLVTR